MLKSTLGLVFMTKLVSERVCEPEKLVSINTIRPNFPVGVSAYADGHFLYSIGDVFQTLTTSLIRGSVIFFVKERKNKNDVK